MPLLHSKEKKKTLALEYVVCINRELLRQEYVR